MTFSPPTVLSLRDAIGARRGDVFSLPLCHDALGDGGGGEFYWDDTSVATDDGGSVLQPGFARTTALPVGRWLRIHPGTLNPKDFGAKGDGRVVLDAAVSGTALTSLAAAFTSADVGRVVAVENCPSDPGSGTVGVSTGVVTGIGTMLTTDYAVGDLIFINGNPYVLNFIFGNTSAQLTDPTVTIAVGKTGYREPRLFATIAAYVSPTQVTLSVAATVAVSAAEAWIGTDDTAACQAAHTAAAAINADVLYPKGIYCLTGNIGVTNAVRHLVWGSGKGVTVLRDMRAWLGGGASLPSQYYGLLSFVNCATHSVADITIRGTGTDVVGANGSSAFTAGRKAIFSQDYNYAEVARVEVIKSRDEALYGSVGVHVGAQITAVHDCWVTNTNSNAINYGTGLVPVSGSKQTITDNHIQDCGYSAFQCNADAAVITDNVVTYYKAYPSGPAPCILLTRSSSIFHDNIFVGTNTQNTGNGIVQISNFDGGAAASQDVSTSVQNNLFIRCRGEWNSPQDGAILIYNAGGSWTLSDNTFVQCGRPYAERAIDARFVFVRGALTGIGKIEGNVFNNASGYNLRVGIEVDSTIPAGSLYVGPNVYVNTSVNELVLGGPILQPGTTQTIVGAGATTVRAGVDTVFVNVNGAVTANLPSPALVGDRKEIRVINSHIQANTTTVATPVSGAMRGATTVVNVDKSNTYKSDGTDWRLVASA